MTNKHTIGSGSKIATRADDIFFYDKLPPEVRHALANAPFSFNPRIIYNRLAAGRITPAQQIASIERASQEKIAKDRRVVWGITALACTLQDLGLE